LDQQEVLSPDYNYRKKEKKIYKINEKKSKTKEKREDEINSFG